PHRYEATHSVAKTGGRADGESARSALRAAPSGRNDDVTRTGMQSARRRKAGERLRNGPRDVGGVVALREPRAVGAMIATRKLHRPRDDDETNSRGAGPRREALRGPEAEQTDRTGGEHRRTDEPPGEDDRRGEPTREGSVSDPPSIAIRSAV